jgi:hypothetical protein
VICRESECHDALLSWSPNVRLTGERLRAKNAVVRPVGRRVRLFGFCVISARRWLRRGIQECVSDQVAVIAFVGLEFSGCGRGVDGEVGGWTGQFAFQVRGNLNASGGGDSSDRVGSRGDDEPDGDHGNAYQRQLGGFNERAGGVIVPNKRS